MTEVVNEVPKKESVKKAIPLTPEERIVLLTELNAIGTLMGCTWNEPKYVGKNTKNPDLQRSIPVNVLSRAMIFRLHTRANKIMEQLGFFDDDFVKAEVEKE